MTDEGVTVFGEVLFDHFPGGTRVMGGAPFNVAWHLQAFGQRPRFVSRVGDDEEGREILASMKAWGMTTDDVQCDAAWPTGQVTVSFDHGEPSYDIVHPCAYDAIEPPASRQSGWLYHGSLAVRDARSRDTLHGLTADDGVTVFLDVNLRDPWWGKAQVQSLLRRADWVKLNEDELRSLGSTGRSDDEAIVGFFEREALQGLLVTYGERGAVMLTRDEGLVRVAPESGTPVEDTVGAGDAFAAVCIMGLRAGWPTEVLLRRAQSFASRVVAQKGATSTDTELYRPLLAQWQIAT